MEREPNIAASTHDSDPLEYVPNPDDEREVPRDDAVETELPPPTLDPEERIEAEPEKDPEAELDG
jgi:hypothetical protein